MKKILLTLIAILFVTSAYAQNVGQPARGWDAVTKTFPFLAVDRWGQLAIQGLASNKAASSTTEIKHLVANVPLTITTSANVLDWTVFNPSTTNWIAINFQVATSTIGYGFPIGPYGYVTRDSQSNYPMYIISSISQDIVYSEGVR